MANIRDLHVGDIVKIGSDHPKGSTTNVHGRIGVVMSIEYNSEDKTIYYRVKDEYEAEFIYLADELYLANDNDRILVIRRLLGMK